MFVFFIFCVLFLCVCVCACVRVCLQCVGNAEAVLFPRGRVCGWPETVGCLLVTYVLAGMVHPVCGTTSMFFSAVVVYYIHSTGAPARP